MAAADFDELFERYESQYARDLDGRLIQVRKATLADLRTIITVKVDDRPVQVPLAVPATDDQGNLLRDAAGDLVPRNTTVLDAVNEAYKAEGTNPVPVLCHQGHVKPVGVCRVCSVMTVRDGKAGDTLIPACIHPIVKGMEVHTPESKADVLLPGATEKQKAGEYVSSTVKVLLELLAVNHLHRAQQEDRPRYVNELEGLAGKFGVSFSRKGDHFEVASPFKRRAYDAAAARSDDEFSRVIAFDPNHCILCDRCVRACSEVKPFKIVGHTGFGYKARVSFDLGPTMAASDCVSCGECATACPTGALAFRGTIYEDRDPWSDVTPRPQTVPAAELARMPLFAGIPYAYLAWNEGAVGRVNSPQGTEMCREGDHGSTAFLIERGDVEIRKKNGDVIGVLTPADILVGEMACLTNQPRRAALAARPGSSFLVLRRNIVHMLRRNRNSRGILHPMYRKRALESYLLKGQLFEGLPPELGRACLADLAKRTEGVEFVQVDPGQAIFLVGQPADYFYIVYRGHVSVSETNVHGVEFVRDCLGEGRHFGEIGLLSGLLPGVAALLPPEARGRRTGTCTALDHVELVQVSGDVLRDLMQQHHALADALEETCRAILARGAEPRRDGGWRPGEFVRAGLYQGQNLLLLDLQKCTRCQECVRACAAEHGGVTRLLLEGNRFGEYLVPSACRSCYDPMCLTGCPVDAIHRRPADRHRAGVVGLAVVIEDHCIGCGLCAHNCPYGSIHMYPRQGGRAARIATNCDLCESLDGRPRCVHHCPHDAAHRLNSREAAGLGGLPLREPGPAHA
ncbi:MAG TPA: cyclic nucleotide-binding domain-containing protein [Gemmataceae bacterium]|nr:cyclic nucleotide-binding domain-containing protein [Gemmataceae bacterium]